MIGWTSLNTVDPALTAEVVLRLALVLDASSSLESSHDAKSHKSGKVLIPTSLFPPKHFYCTLLNLALHIYWGDFQSFLTTNTNIRCFGILQTRTSILLFSNLFTVHCLLLNLLFETFDFAHNLSLLQFVFSIILYDY